MLIAIIFPHRNVADGKTLEHKYALIKLIKLDGLVSFIQ